MNQIALTHSGHDSPQSMTGFATATSESTVGTIDCQVRSVNHRHLDVVVRLPKHWSVYEATVKSLVGRRLRRGRVEVTLSKLVPNSLLGTPTIDFDLAHSYLKAFKSIASAHEIGETYAGYLLAELLLRGHEPPSQEISDKEAHRETEAVISQLVEKTLEKISSVRQREGEALITDLLSRTAVLQSIVDQINDGSLLTQRSYLDKLSARLRALQEEHVVEPSRLAQECMLLVEKSDISEEIVRIKAHLTEVQRLCGLRGTGKNLDFFAQELHREFNTISNKVQDATLQALSVSARVEIERCREQVQNIE